MSARSEHAKLSVFATALIETFPSLNDVIREDLADVHGRQRKSILKARRQNLGRQARKLFPSLNQLEL